MATLTCYNSHEIPNNYIPDKNSAFESCSQCTNLHFKGEDMHYDEAPKEVKHMAEINLDGSAPEGTVPKVKLQHEERYSATFKECRVQEVSDFDDKTKKINKIIIDWELKDGKKTHTIPMWTNPKVSKGSGTYSNSTLYDTFEKLGVLKDFATDMKDKTEISDEDLSTWMNDNMTDLEATVELRNRKIGTPEEYSNIGKVVKLL